MRFKTNTKIVDLVTQDLLSRSESRKRTYSYEALSMIEKGMEEGEEDPSRESTKTLECPGLLGPIGHAVSESYVRFCYVNLNKT